MVFPGGPVGIEFASQCRRPWFNPWVGISWRKKWQPTPVPLPGESQGQRSLVGYSPWGHKGSDMSERLTRFHFPGSELWYGGSSLEIPGFLHWLCGVLTTGPPGKSFGTFSVVVSRGTTAPPACVLDKNSKGIYTYSKVYSKIYSKGVYICTHPQLPWWLRW